MRKKAFSIILLSLVSFGFVQCKKSNDGLQQSLDALTLEVAELKSMLQKAESEKSKSPKGKVSGELRHQILDKVKEVSKFLFDQFKFVVDKSDKIVSKKFFISAMLIIGPAVFLYSKIFGVNLTGTIINKITGIFLDGGTDAAKNVADAVIDKAPEITEVVIDKGQEIAEKVIDTASSKVLEDPKTVAKIVGVWFGLNAMRDIAVKTVSKVGEAVAPVIVQNAVPVTLTTVSLVTSPWSLFVTVPAFAAHLYFHH